MQKVRRDFDSFIVMLNIGVVLIPQSLPTAAQAFLRVEELVRMELKGWKAKKPELGPFQIDEEAAFYCFWREDRATTDGLACIPAVPDSKGRRPSLLLFDLENERHKDTRAYQ